MSHATEATDATDDAGIAGIQDLFARMYDAWRRGDAAAYAACLTDDADYVVFDGTRLRGRADNAAQHQALFDTLLRGSRLTGQTESIAMLSPDVALVHSVGAVAWPWEDAPSPKAQSRQTMVVVRQGGRWLARAFHNTRVRPLPPIDPRSFGIRLFRAYVWLRTRLAGRR